ncbi:hypothetical protein BSZ36_11260 [Rubricoccus marinus]|uniref:DUF3308 domain-containing protein n=2 Tax=Rubricoccus marinus TaxID=716817 RepID=A0A259U411_9BACT|nr:hypothetical protein BSZ36_11260 [Rubricoccus marinus]
MKFLAVSADPRSAALGNAMTSLVGGSDALFYNPAALAWQEADTDAMISNTQWIASIDYNHASLSYKAGNLGVFGGSLAFADYGDLTQTVFEDSDQGYREIGSFSPSAWMAGIGYARAFSDQFSAGGQVKYARQDFGAAPTRYDEGGELQFTDVAQGVLAYDFGVFYKTGFESLNFALSARNFSQEVTFEDEGAQLPLTLHIGVSMDVLDLTPMATGPHSLLLSVDAENPRDFSEQLKVGAEYTFAETLSLRAGYVSPTDEQGISLGAGVKQSVAGLGIGADYAYTDFGVFDAVHRVAVHLSF